MKTVPLLLMAFAPILFVTSCKKESTSNSLVGKWQVQERFSGYANGGDFNWSSVPVQYRYTIEFNHNGSFNEVKSAGSLPDQCSGTYSRLDGDKIQVYSNCNTLPLEWMIDVSNDNLIITHIVREGEIKEKFIKID